MGKQSVEIGDCLDQSVSQLRFGLPTQYRIRLGDIGLALPGIVRRQRFETNSALRGRQAQPAASVIKVEERASVAP